MRSATLRLIGLTVILFYSFNGVAQVTQYPYVENFESNDGGWITDGSNNTWEHGNPAASSINEAIDCRDNIWTTNLAGDYNNVENSYLESPLFDFSGFGSDPLIRFAHNYITEPCCDEGWVEVSTDGGSSYSKLGTASSGGQNWYNDAGNDWWDGSSGGWQIASHPLTGTAGADSVKIRFMFSSDGSSVRNGFAVDNIYIDADITNAIDSFPTLCNDAPVASNVSFNGMLTVGEVLTGSYTYSDTNNNAESGSVYTWFRSNDSTGTGKVAIAGATDSTYTLTAADTGKYISFQVAPSDGQDTGTAVESSLQGPVMEQSAVIIPICYGDMPGIFDNTDSISGGVGPFVYSWEVSTDMGASWMTAPGKNDSIAYEPGIALFDTTFYRRLVIDQSCFDSAYSNVIEVHVPDSLYLDTTITNVSCNSFSDGAIDVTVVGGASPYSYLWSTGATTQDISNLAAGTYTVTVTDDFSCTVVNSYIITEPPVLVAAGVVDSNITCNSFSDGGATASATGGTMPYTYLWSNAATNASITGVTAGTYSVTITDANGCTDSASVTVTEPAVLVASSVVDSNESCTGQFDGGTTASATGGTPPYTFNWSNSATTASITGLGAGTYTVTVTDANGCSDTASSTVILLDITPPTVITKNFTAYLDASGNVTVMPSDVDSASFDACGLDSLGVSPNTFNCSNIGANTVTLTVYDVSANVDSATATVTVVDTVKPDVLTQNITVYLDANGQASITTGDIDNGSTDACGIQSMALDTTSFDCDDLGANTVTLSVTDVNNNIGTNTAIVTVVDTFVPVAVAQNLTVYLDANGQATITPQMADNGSSDNCPLSYSLSQSVYGCGDEGLNLETLTVTDGQGNNASATFLIDVQDTISPTLVTKTITIQLGATGQVSIAPSQLDDGSFDNCANQLFYSASQTSFDCNDLGVNVVTITITDTEGNSTTGTDTVIVEDNINPVALSQNLTVQLDANGQGNITPMMVNNGSSDNCSIDSMWVSQENFTCSDLGQNSIVFSVMDPSGNISSTNAIITVEDNIAPTVLTQNLTIYLDASGQASITAMMVDNGSSDNCSINSLSLDMMSFDCTHLGANTVTLTATDESNNSNSLTATVTVEDTISPTVVTQNITVQLDANGQASITPSMIDNGSSDNCSISNLSLDITSFNCSNLGPNTVTLTATDGSNNTKMATAIVTVEDNVAPNVITQSITVQLDANGQASITPMMINNGSTDNCSIASMSLDITSFDCSNLGANTVTLTLTDNSNNTSSGTATVTVEDNIAPVATTQNLAVQLDANGQATITPMMVNNGSTDNCGIEDMSLDITSFGCSDLGPNTVTLTVTDSSNNSNSTTATITVEDNIVPTVLTQNITVQLDASGQATITPTMIDNGSFDNCNISNLSLDITSFNCSDKGSPVTVTLTATDGSNNSNSNTALVTVEDNVVPVARTQNITIYLDASGNSSITPADIDNSSFDNCGIDTLALDIDVFDCADLGQNLVTLTVTDSSNNSSSATAFVTVLDTIDPTIDNLPATITAYTNANQCATTVQWPTITASDNCNSTFINTSQINGGLFSKGTTTVIVNVFDGSNNAINRSFDVIVLDTISPVITGVPFTFNITPNATTCDAVVSWNAPTAFDNCGTVNLTSSHTPGSTFPVGSTVVTYTATDPDLNSTSVSFTVTVTDVIDPTITGVPADITQSADAGSCDAVVNYTLPTVSDNCTGAVLATSHASGSVFPVGTTVVTFTATDAANNITTDSFTITVTDDEDPVVTSVPPSDTVGPCDATYTYPLPTGTDNCGPVTVTQISGLPSGNIFPIGITQNVFRISDPSGNDTVVSFTIVIVPQGQPQLPQLLEICENAPSVDIALGQNIVWTGSGVINGNTFNPAAAGVGRHVLSYSFTDDQGCIATGSISVTVLPIPSAPVIIRVASTTLSTLGNYATYQWYRDGVAIPGANSQTYSYTVGGNYQVVVGNTSGCETFGNGFVIGTSGGGIGLEEYTLSELSLYPNPTDGRVTIDLNSEGERDLKLTVFSVDGKKIHQEDTRSETSGKVYLDLTDLPDATYFLYIQSDKETAVRKIVLY